MGNNVLSFKAINITKSEDDDCLIPMNKGWMLTPEQTKLLIKGLEEYAKHGEEITKFNSAHKNEIEEYYKEYQMPIKRQNYVMKEAKTVEGNVYIVRMDKYYKIGKTLDMTCRMGEYTLLPIEPEIVFCKRVDDYTKSEKTLHEQYANKRVRGEWFKLDEEDIKLADKLI